MEAIVIFSHGSVLCGAERNLLEVAERMRTRGDAPIVEVGFLNYTDPLFDVAVGRCVAQGATRIVIAPYFLIAGKFVVEDLPGRIAEAKSAHPTIEFATADVIGPHPALADAILGSASTAQRPEQWLEAMVSNEQWCRESPKCPFYGSSRCRAGMEVRA